MDVKYFNFSRFLALPREIKVFMMMLVDSCLCCLSVWFSYYLRLGNFSTPIEWMFAPISLSIIISFFIFWFMDIYKNISRSFDRYNIVKLFKAVLIYSIIFFVIITIFSIEHVPRTVGLIQPILYLFLLYFQRLILNYLLNYEQIEKSNIKKKSALIYGSGNAGIQLMNSLENSDLFIEGFIDDNDQLKGRTLNGKYIYSTKDIGKLIKSKNINQVLVAIPSLTRNERSNIFKRISKYPVKVKALPTLSDLAEGLVKITDIQEPNVEDLLGREEIDPNPELMKKNIFKKVVLISGAGGSIGSELCRQIIKLNPKRLLLFENNEFALYKIITELEEIKKNNINSVSLISVLGSITDKDLLDQTISNYKPDTIFHSAAYKHVSLVEQNIAQGIKNNVYGTINIYKSAVTNEVSNFVLISTDKAVKPKNVMGATKRLAEMYLQAFNQLNNFNSKTNCTIVRFGNVLESSGSVIPIFREQIKNGGPLTLSHNDVTRYFMTIPEASSLVIQASAMSKKDEIFVLDMGKPIKILDLALKMISLSGHTVKDKFHPYGDIEIVIKGLYPGEKLHEDLLIGKNPLPTEHPKILKVKDSFIEFKELEKKLEELKFFLNQRNLKKIINFFNELSEDFNLDLKNIDLNIENKNLN